MKIRVKVVPRSSKDSVEEVDGVLVVRTTKAPVKGEANRAVIALLAKHFGVSKSGVELVTGHTTRFKVFDIDE